MTTHESSSSTVLAGGQDRARRPHPAIGSQRPAAEEGSGGAAAGAWPSWARPQLERAVALATAAPDSTSVARLLYRSWYSPRAAALPSGRLPLVGSYRVAHAGSARRVRRGGVSVVERYDLIGPDGWWRTWGRNWTPPRSRPGSIRLMLTPHPQRLAELVSTVTTRLLDSELSWSLGCAIDPRRVARLGCAVLDLPARESVPADLLGAIAPLLQPVAPPLCLPVAPGVGLAEYPDNGMTFGEHRCHLIALALRHPSGARDPLRSIAAVFAAHGLDPAAPYAA